MLMQDLRERCHTGNHEYHIWVPWMHGTPYDKVCDICSHQAAWTSGKGVSLCDCCAQDWSDWCGYRRIVHNTNYSLKSVWPVEYAEFKRWALKCL